MARLTTRSSPTPCPTSKVLVVGAPEAIFVPRDSSLNKSLSVKKKKKVTVALQKRKLRVGNAAGEQASALEPPAKKARVRSRKRSKRKQSMAAQTGPVVVSPGGNAVFGVVEA